MKCFKIFFVTDSSTDGLFKISSDKGVISVKSVIDREVVEVVNLTVKVKYSYVLLSVEFVSLGSCV